MTQFVLANFATTTLMEELEVGQTELFFNTNDQHLFPTLALGTKFPLVLTEPTTSNFPEVVYATAVGEGVMTVERAQEGTLEQHWLAGSQINHTLTAESVKSLIGLIPKGEWNSAINYQPRDVVEYLGTSYIAVVENINSTPSNVNANWQSVFLPSGVDSGAVSWAGRWASATAYVANNIVEYNGRLWVSKTDNINQTPAAGSSHWEDIARWARSGDYVQTLAALGTNNYTVSPAVGDMPSTLFDGMVVYTTFENANTTTTPTLKIGAFAAVTLKDKVGGSLEVGALQPGVVYVWQYNQAGTAFIAVQAAGKPSNLTLVDTRSPTFGGLVLSGTQPVLDLVETDQTLPAGRWRWAAASGAVSLQRNTAVAGDFSSSALPISVDSADLVTLLKATIGGTLGVTGVAALSGGITTVSITASGTVASNISATNNHRVGVGATSGITKTIFGASSMGGNAALFNGGSVVVLVTVAGLDTAGNWLLTPTFRGTGGVTGVTKHGAVSAWVTGANTVAVCVAATHTGSFAYNATDEVWVKAERYG